MLEQGPDFWCWFDTTQFSYIYIPLCSPNTCKYVFNPNVTTFQSNCAEGLHFSAFIHYFQQFIVKMTSDYLPLTVPNLHNSVGVSSKRKLLV